MYILMDLYLVELDNSKVLMFDEKRLHMVTLEKGLILVLFLCYNVASDYNEHKNSRNIHFMMDRRLWEINNIWRNDMALRTVY